MTIAWEGGGTLECTDNLTSPPGVIVWTSVTSTSPYNTTTTGAARRLYRVRQ